MLDLLDLQLVRIVHQDKDDLAFERIINNPKRSIGDSTIKLIHQFAKKETKPIYNNNSFMYEFLTSFRDKINAPFKKKDK